MSNLRTCFAVLATVGVLVLVSGGPALAVPTAVSFINGPQDPLFVPQLVHELGEGPAFLPYPDEMIVTNFAQQTTVTACFDGSDNPTTPNAWVSITNLTPINWTSVWYVADPSTFISNFDGFVGNTGVGDYTFAFKIDSTGINKPLISESGPVDGIFQAGETWEFIIQDFFSPFGGPTPFDTVGIASFSGGVPLSTGSIIAVPEPSTLALCSLLGAVGMVGVWRRRRRIQ